MPRTQADRKAETHERLLDAAAALFARNGFDGVSTDAVAEAADRTSGALYAHFGSKEGLLLALLGRWEQETATAMGTAMDAEDDPRGRVRALWETFARSGREGGPDGLLLEHELWLYAARHPEVAERVARRYAAARATTARSFATWAGHGGTDSGADPTTTATLVMALLLGLEMQRRLEPEAVPDDLATLGLSMLLDA